MKKVIIAITMLLLVILVIAVIVFNNKSENNIANKDNIMGNNEENNVNQTNSNISQEYDSVYPYHEPYGEGVGIKAGRVVWNHNPNSVNWDGNGYWWETDHFDSEVILEMINDSIASLGDKDTAKEGWDELFKYFNNNHNKGNVGYKENEKIVIKANINGSAVMDDDTSGKTNMSYTN
ncbi:MAG: hypothetical protein ACLUD1_04940, partial [Clostridia bacterium]